MDVLPISQHIVKFAQMVILKVELWVQEIKSNPKGELLYFPAHYAEQFNCADAWASKLAPVTTTVPKVRSVSYTSFVWLHRSIREQNRWQSMQP